MNSPIIWIFFPALVSLGLFLMRRNRTTTYLSGFISSLGFALLVLWLPVDSIIKIGTLEFKIFRIILHSGSTISIRTG